MILWYEWQALMGFTNCSGTTSSPRYCHGFLLFFSDYFCWYYTIYSVHAWAQTSSCWALTWATFITNRLINIQCENNCLQNNNSTISSLQIGVVHLLCINIEGILMADGALLAGYHRHRQSHCPCLRNVFGWVSVIGDHQLRPKAHMNIFSSGFIVYRLVDRRFPFILSLVLFLFIV